MIDDIKTVIWKEWRELAAQGVGEGFSQTASIVIGVVLMGAIAVIAGFAGSVFIRTPFAVVIGLCPVLLVMGQVCDSFAGERERHTLETLLASRLPDQALLIGKIAALVLYGYALGVAMLLMSLVGANLNPEVEGFEFFPPSVALAAFGVSFLVSLMLATLGVLYSLRAKTVREAQAKVMITFLAMTIPFVVVRPFLPHDARESAIRMLSTESGRMQVVLAWLLVLLAIDVVLLLLASARFRRARLIAG